MPACSLLHQQHLVTLIYHVNGLVQIVSHLEETGILQVTDTVLKII